MHDAHHHLPPKNRGAGLTPEPIKELWDREYAAYEAAPTLGDDDKPPMFPLVRDPLGIVWRVNRTRCVIDRLPRTMTELPKGYRNVARWHELVQPTEWVRRGVGSERFRYGYGPVN